MAIRKDEVTYTFDLSEVVPEFTLLDSDQKDHIKSLVAETVIDGIQSHLDKSSSPVSKGKFKSFKKDGDPSQLFDKGKMRKAISWKEGEGDNIEVGIFSAKEAIKAFNHNTGDTLPTRKFIPSEDEKFKVSILNAVKRVIRDEI